MRESIFIVNCTEPSEASDILAMLEKKPDSKGVKVSHAAVVKKEEGELSLEDGFVVGDAEEENAWAGGLIGGLVGLLGGPIGALVAGGVGALIGGSLGKEELKGATALLSKASECLVDGECALLLLAEAKGEAALADRLKDYQVAITCLDAEEIAEEIEIAKKAAKKAKKAKAEE